MPHNRQGARGRIPAAGPALCPVSYRLQLRDATFQQDALLSAGSEGCPRGCNPSACPHVLQGGRQVSSLVLENQSQPKTLAASAQHQHSAAQGSTTDRGKDRYQKQVTKMEDAVLIGSG